MSDQAEVHSIESLKDLRTAMALYEEDALGALGAVEAEVKRTVLWLNQDRPLYWQEQIKRRREQVSAAKAEVFRKQLQKKPDYSPSMSEPVENLRRAEASLQDAEKRLTMVKKWQPLLQQAILEYHGSVQRIKDHAASDVPRAVATLQRMIDALEAYLRVAAPSGSGFSPVTTGQATASTFEAIATQALDAEPAQPEGERNSADEVISTTNEPNPGPG